MSLAKEDWKRFLLMSGQLKMNDASHADDGVIVNVENGDWVAMCERDDDNNITQITAMLEKLAENMQGDAIKVDPEVHGCCTHEKLELDSDSGLVFFIDRRMENRLSQSFCVPEHRLNPKVVEKYGRPEQEGKDEEERFVETLFHLGRDCAANMPALESLDFGAVFEIGSGKVSVDMLYNGVRDVIGFEVTRRG